MVQIFLTQKIANSLSSKFGTNISVGGVSVRFFKSIVLKDVLVEDQNRDSLLFVQELAANIDSFSLRKHYVSIGKLKLVRTLLNVKSDSTGETNYQFLLGPPSPPTPPDSTTKAETSDFNLIISKFDFSGARARIAYTDSTGQRNIAIDNISFGVSELKMMGDNFSFQIDKFSLDDQKEFVLEDFRAKVCSTPDSLIVEQLHAKTPYSVITEANLFADKRKMEHGFDIGQLKVNIDLKKSLVGLKDVGALVPWLKGMDADIEVSGQVSGRLADLKGKNIEISLGDNTRLALDVYMSGLPDIAKTYMHVDLKQSFADLRELAQVKLPDNFPMARINFSPSFMPIGVIEYNGNFTGFLSDFVAYGTFKSAWGVITTDLSFVPSSGEKLKMNGRVKTVNFKLGKLAGSSSLDRVTFNGDIKGFLDQKSHNFIATVSGKVDSVDMKGYQYKNIVLNGDIFNKHFDGRLLTDDPNLKVNFEGGFDFNVDVPMFNFNMLVEKANLKALKLVDGYDKIDVAFAMNANFTGNNIDNLSGAIHFSEGLLSTEHGAASFKNIDIRTFYENEPILQVRSDFLDADIRGQYQLHNLPGTVMKIVNRHLPSAGLFNNDLKINNIFDFKLDLKDVNRFAKVLSPDLRIEPGEVDGSINSEKDRMIVKALFPEIQYQSTLLRGVTLNVDGENKFRMRNKISEVGIGSQFKIHNFSLVSEASGDVLDSKLAWNNYEAQSFSGSLSTSARFFKQKGSPHVEIGVKPSRIYVADSLWFINSALITVDSSLIKVNKFKLSNKSQSIVVDGSISNNQDDRLNMVFGQLDLRSVNDLLGEGFDLKGELNGMVSVLDVYQRPLFLANLKVDKLGLLGQALGDALVQSRWNRDEQAVEADLLVKSGERESLHAFGSYIPTLDSLSIYTKFDDFSLLILQPLMGSSFANFRGGATGKVWVHGPLNHIKHDGALYAANAGLKLSQLQVNYSFNDSVRFIGDKIVFPDIKLREEYGNVGIFSGSIQHRSFSGMIYDLTVTIPKGGRILAINTSPAINQQFYGKLFGSGVVHITGKGERVFIGGTVRTERGTEMIISLGYEEDAQEYDFLSFVTHGYQSKTKQVERVVDNSDLQMRFDVELTPEAKVQLIYNSEIGDIIRSQGSGNLRVLIDNESNVSLFGKYTVQQGDCLFTLQNVINKKFDIQQGGTIEWNGDPGEAILDLNAIYRLKASLGELFASSTGNADYNQRIPVMCKIKLTKNLSNPDIKFDIELPTTENRIKDEVRQYISSDEDMNKQILSLLVLGKFYTPEYLRGTYSGSSNNLMGTTASELFSNQLSSWLSKISNDFDIGVNYRPGNEITDDQIELALSTQMFNDRVSINGNIGNNTSQRTNTSSGIVGDAEVNVKLTNSGKLQLKAYNHANNNLIYETSPYTQGVGLSYREDFNNFQELWQKMKSLFKWKNQAKSKAKMTE